MPNLSVTNLSWDEQPDLEVDFNSRTEAGYIRAIDRKGRALHVGQRVLVIDNDEGPAAFATVAELRPSDLVLLDVDFDSYFRPTDQLEWLVLPVSSASGWNFWAPSLVWATEASGAELGSHFGISITGSTADAAASRHGAKVPVTA